MTHNVTQNISHKLSVKVKNQAVVQIFLEKPQA